MYSHYVSVAEQLRDSEKENRRLNAFLRQIQRCVPVVECTQRECGRVESMLCEVDVLVVDLVLFLVHALRCSELEEKAPVIEEQRLAYERMSASHAQLTQRLQAAVEQSQEARGALDKAHRDNQRLAQENQVGVRINFLRRYSQALVDC